MSGLRTITASLWQNLGTGQPGASFDLGGRMISLGQLSWSADERLTKVSPGDITLKIEDNDGALWTFLQDQIGISTGLLPPWLLVDVDGVRRFLGVVNPKGLRFDPKTREVEVTGQDWSILLANTTLGGSGWERAIPKAAGGRDGSETRPCNIGWVLGVVLNVIYYAGPNNWLQNGDQVTCALIPGKTYKILGTGEYGTGWSASLAPDSFSADFMAANPGATSATLQNVNFTRLPAPSSSTTYYKVTQAITVDNDIPTYQIALDTVDGIAPGDTLGLILTSKSASFVVINVDAERKWVITREPVQQNLAVDDRLYFSPESIQELVFEDARSILALAVTTCNGAATGYKVDLSRFTSAVLPDPVLAWLPLRPMVGDDLHAVADVEPGLSDLRVLAGDGTAWDGTPEAGWTAVGGTPAKRAVWTSQLTMPPASLMPDETATLNTLARRRNRAYGDGWKWLQQDNGDRGAGEWTSTLGAQAGLVVVHDYPGMRRFKCNGSTVTTQAWTGTWGADTAFPWSGGSILSACIMPGMPGALLARTAAGLVLGGSASGTCGVPAEAVNAVLTTTPWGAYLVSAQGYGRVDWTGSGITLHWVTLTDQVTGFFPNTLAGLTPDELVMLGRFDAQDRTGKAVTETYFFRLAALPVIGDASASVIWAEKVTTGAPTLIGCFRDPTKLGRVIGQLGGRLFQVDRALPFTLERFKPSGMNALELVEHICQLHNAVAVPDPTGTLQVVSRNFLDQVYDLTIERISRKITRTWEHFYSLIRVSTTDDEEYADALGQEGGKLLEVTKHPLVWTKSGCAAMSKSLALWFGKPRTENAEVWFSSNTSAPPPWELLPRIARVRINGGTTLYVQMGGQENLKTREATVALVEVGAAGYGMSYGRSTDL